MARLVVQYPGFATVLLNGRPAGGTNAVLSVNPGSYRVQLEAVATEPAHLDIEVALDALAVHSLSPADEPVDRFSPLYCRYNGFLLGQFLSLSFARSGRPKYAERRARIMEFLEEAGVAASLPEEPVPLGGAEHAGLLEALLPQLAARSPELAHFALLGGLLTHYGGLHESDPATAKETLEAIEVYRAKYDLPAFEPGRFHLKTDDLDEVLSPSLEYLRQTIAPLEPEPKTAFVIMPFRPPYGSYFATFYRPSLEAASYRAFRAWGGLASEDYIDLVLDLIRKSGIVWADLSEMNLNVLYEVGAAHASGKMAVLVASASAGPSLHERIPANIGKDVVVRYEPGSADWPCGAVRLQAVIIAAMTDAASRGERLRVRRESVTAELDRIGQAMRSLLFPPEAYQAANDAREAMTAHRYKDAEQLYSEAIAFGLNDAANLLGRGLVRLMLERWADAEADLGEAIGQQPGNDLLASAYHLRGIARAQLGRDPEAEADQAQAAALGYEPGE